MSNTGKKVVSIIGIVFGAIIIVIGFAMQDTSNYHIGKDIMFGADFYTEIYDVTKDVGRAINNAINDLICAISWLIISLGVIDVCFFVYKLVSANSTLRHYNIQTADRNDRVLSNTLVSESKEEYNLRQEDQNWLRNAANQTTPNVTKTCPYCGEIVKSNKCEMCGKEIVL